MLLHVVFDEWIQNLYADNPHGNVRWERYADDIIVHCKTQMEARYLLTQIRKRMKSCKLELHPEKTKIVYCKQSSWWGKQPSSEVQLFGF